MSKIQLHDIVAFKATPNSGEMIVSEIYQKFLNFPHADNFNPVVLVKYWDPEKKEYQYERFYSNDLIKVEK